MPSADNFSSSSVSRSASLDTRLSATPAGLEPGMSESQGGGTDGEVHPSGSSGDGAGEAGERVGEIGLVVVVLAKVEVWVGVVLVAVPSEGLEQALIGRAGRSCAGGGGRRPLGKRSLDFLTGTGGGTGGFFGSVRSGGEVGGEQIGEARGDANEASWDPGGLLVRNGDRG